jgi:hypothetical protein
MDAYAQQYLPCLAGRAGQALAQAQVRHLLWLYALLSDTSEAACQALAQLVTTPTELALQRCEVLSGRVVSITDRIHAILL